MHIVVYIFAALYILLALGLGFAYYRHRHPGTFFMALGYGGSAGIALYLMDWWPLIAGFLIAWLLRFMGLDPQVERQPRE